MPLLVSKVDPLRTRPVDPAMDGEEQFTGPSNRHHGAYFTEYLRQVTFSVYLSIEVFDSAIVFPE
jgi:hypothetical protein